MFALVGSEASAASRVELAQGETAPAKLAGFTPLGEPLFPPESDIWRGNNFSLSDGLMVNSENNISRQSKCFWGIMK